MAGVTSDTMSMVCCVAGLHPAKVGETTVGRRSRLWALAQAYLPEMSEQEVAELVVAMLGSESVKEKAPPELTRKVLPELDVDEVKNFQHVTQKLDDDFVKEALEMVGRRTPADKKRMENKTPDSIKGLRPTDHPTRCKLVWDRGLSAFEAYYPCGKPKPSTAQRYGQGKSMFASLKHCVDYVWMNHDEKGCVESLA
jgi:hypothetical protein